MSTKVRQRIWRYRGTLIFLSSLMFFAVFTLTYVKPMAQSMRTMREVYNFVYDEVNKRLMTTPWAGAQSVKYTETEILNFVYDPACHCLKVSGGGGGTGTVDVSGTPTLDQLAAWVDQDTLKGISSLSMNVTSLDVTGASLTAPNRTGTVLPPTCTILGETFYKTDTFVSYVCTAANVWTVLGGSSTFTSVLKAPDGAVGAPAYSFTSDATTGIWKDSGGLHITQAGQDQARFTTGFVMIGSSKIAYGATVAGSADMGLERESNTTLQVNSGTLNTLRDIKTRQWVSGGIAFASLGTPSNGTFVYCSDCTVTATCAGSGTGALAKRLNGAWVCN